MNVQRNLIRELMFYEFEQWLGSIAVVCALTRYALLHSVRDLKAAQMNVQPNLIRELMLYEFEQWLGSIVVVGALTRYALLHSVRDLKAAQMNVQRNLIQELMFYELELRHNLAEATRNICCTKGEGTPKHSRVTRWIFKKYRHGYKTPDDEARSGRPKTVNYKVVLQALKANLVSSTRRVSGNLGTVVHHLHDHSKNIHQGWRNQSVLLFTHSWGENN